MVEKACAVGKRQKWKQCPGKSVSGCERPSDLTARESTASDRSHCYLLLRISLSACILSTQTLIFLGASRRLSPDSLKNFIHPLSWCLSVWPWSVICFASQAICNKLFMVATASPLPPFPHLQDHHHQPQQRS